MAEGNEFNLKQGDTYPAIRARLEQYNHTIEAFEPINLSGATVRIRMSIEGAGNQLIDAPADIVDAAGGIVEYWFAIDGSETTEVGTHQVEWEVTFANNRKATIPRGATPNFNQVIIEARVT